MSDQSPRRGVASTPPRLSVGQGTAITAALAAPLAIVTWTGWAVFIVLRLRQNYRDYSATPPRPSALADYFEFLTTFWNREPLYLPDSLQGFHYLPSMLVIYTPLTWLGDWTTVTTVAGVLYAALLTYAVLRLASALWPGRAASGAGAVLAVSMMATSLPLGLLNATVPMTALMILAAAAAIDGRLRHAALWVGAAVAIKPLALTMALLMAATMPRTRLIVAATVVGAILLPFAFQDPGYLLAEYSNNFRQLSRIADAPPGEWIYQVDYSTFLHSYGIDLPAPLRGAVRVAAALVALLLAWRVTTAGDERATSLALLVLACSYIALFNPRHEYVAFLVVVPALAAVGLVALDRSIVDWGGWAFVGLALMIGSRWSHHTEPYLKPPFMIAVWIFLLVLMFPAARWRAFVARRPL